MSNLSFKPRKTIILPLSFLFAVLTLTLSPLSVSNTAMDAQHEFIIPVPVALVTVTTPKTFPSNNLPEAETISVTAAKTVVKSIRTTPIAVTTQPTLKKSVTRLEIPSIKVDALIQSMGLTAQGAMAVPNNNADVGWYSPGTRPGATGSAVIGGHNSWNQTAGVFARLNELKPGDTVSVVDANGLSTAFVVRGTQTYDAIDLSTGIFMSPSGIHLNLITCSGVWNPATQTYTKRLVVFTDAVQVALK